MSVPVDSVKGGTKEIANEAMNIGSGLWDMITMKMTDIIPGLLSMFGKLLLFVLFLIIATFVINWVIKLLKKAIEKAQLDSMIEKIGLTRELSNMGVSVTPSGFITGVVSLVLKFVMWMVAISILKIQALTDLMDQIVGYLDNIVISIILLFAGLTIAKMVKDLIEKSASSLSVTEGTAALFGKIAKIAILTLTVLAVLNQLNIATDLVNTLFQGVVYGLTIAGGVAFGLGGQGKAKELLEKMGK